MMAKLVRYDALERTLARLYEILPTMAKFADDSEAV